MRWRGGKRYSFNKILLGKVWQNTFGKSMAKYFWENTKEKIALEDRFFLFIIYS
jgi:hypothetical protein